ncbi:MAG TPA: DUF6228 family protein [Gemmatimonadaceae bacterium]|nr:DUF6228 family protein [Gemmatimonadaceae bacterium]
MTTKSTLRRRELTIRSVAGDAALSFSEPLPDDPSHPVSSFVAALEFTETFVSLRASTRIAVHDAEELVAFFRALARDAHGFVGERVWFARERELVLRADHDGSPRMVLTVVMHPEYDPPPFTAEYKLRLPVAGLARLASDLARFVRAE